MNFTSVQLERIIRALDAQSSKCHKSANSMYNRGNFGAEHAYRTEAESCVQLASEMRHARGLQASEIFERFEATQKGGN